MLTCSFATLAHAIDFDYESTPLASFSSSFSVTKLGLTCTATSSGGWLHVSSHDVPVEMGSRYIIANHSSGFAIPTSPFSPLSFTFSQTVGSATLLAGDTGGDNDGFVTVDLYDSNNVFLGRNQSFLGTSAHAVAINITTPFRTAVVDTTNTTFNPHSVGAEFHNVTVAPEPATLLAFAAPFLGLLIRRRARS